MKSSVTVVAKVELSANEWELYTCSKKCGTAARKLNAAANKALKTAHKTYKDTGNKDTALSAAWKVWSPVSHDLREFGASDSEPRWHFEDLLVKFFLKPHDLNDNW